MTKVYTTKKEAQAAIDGYYPICGRDVLIPVREGNGWIVQLKPYNSTAFERIVEQHYTTGHQD